MNRLLVVTLFGLSAFSGNAFANLPRSSVTSMVATVYGLYTTSDPTCQTGLLPTIPLSANPVSIDMTKSPDMGTGAVASPPNCVVTVMKSSIQMGWSAGTYATSTINGSNTFADSVCNTGGTINQKICTNQSVTWLPQVAADMTLVGLPMTNACPASPTGNEIISTYISTNSACTGQTRFDAVVPICTNNRNSFQPPTGPGSGLGMKLAPVAGGAPSYKMVFDPDQALGGGAQGANACGSVSPPLFSFAAN